MTSADDRYDGVRKRVGRLAEKALSATFGLVGAAGYVSRQRSSTGASEGPSVPGKHHAAQSKRAMARSMRSTVQMLSVDLIPRDFSHPDNLDRAANYIARMLKKSTNRVREQTFQVGRNTYQNVIATLGPETTPRIVVGAHYDAVETTPGADDNASAVAGLIELAALLSHDTLPVRVELVAFTLEEPPHFGTQEMGSALHAASLSDEGATVIAMIALEMIGYYDDREGSQRFPLPGMQLLYGNVGNFICVVGRTDQLSLVNSVAMAMRGASPLRVAEIAAPSAVEGVDLSDHRNYWQRGFPAVMITDTAFYRNEQYHLAGDTLDRLDFNRMVDVVMGVRAAVLALAERANT